MSKQGKMFESFEEFKRNGRVEEASAEKLSRRIARELNEQAEGETVELSQGFVGKLEQFFVEVEKELGEGLDLDRSPVFKKPVPRRSPNTPEDTAELIIRLSHPEFFGSEEKEGIVNRALEGADIDPEKVSVQISNKRLSLIFREIEQKVSRFVSPVV